ncbi:MAG TPA: UPF0175 family protein [Chitinophagales bacterium]|nr:UPF0175 family protein [Chitinophagales bacterium]
MKTITLEIPEGVKLTERDAAMIVAGKLWADGQLSYGQAADMVGISKKEFIEQLGVYGYPFTNISVEDLQHDLNMVKEFSEKYGK